MQIDQDASKIDISKGVARLCFHADKSVVCLFVDLHLVQDDQSEEFLLEEFGRLPADVRTKTKIVFHNHDKLPSLNFFKCLNDLCFDTFCVNIIDESVSVTPLPIGLENRWRLNNGRISPFVDAQLRLKRRDPRSQMVFAAFDVRTNYPERSVARQACIEAGVSFYDHRISPRLHRRLLLDTHFVISPPGNGLDCHRTWEAIYLGCVPVVLRRALADEFTTSLPIHAVDNWIDFLDLSESEKFSLYLDTRARSTELAFAPYWRRRLHDVKSR